MIRSQIGPQISPAAVSQWTRTIGSAMALLPLLAIAGVLAAYALRLVFAPTLWLDEAMLVVNVRTIAWSDLFSPLPFYDQVAPLAYIALLKVIDSLGGLNEGLLRLPSFLALLGSLTLIARLPGTQTTTRLIMGAMLAGSFVTVRLATEAKPYMLEVFFAIALITAFHPAAMGVWTRWWVRLGLLIAAAVTTTAFPIVAFAIGAPTLLMLLREDIQGSVRFARWQSLPMAALFAFALLFYIVYFLAYSADSLRLVAANHAYGYAADGYNVNGVFYPSWFIGRFVDIVRSHWSELPVLVLGLVLIGVHRLTRNRSIYALQFGTLFGFILVLNLAGHFPIMEGRFSMFMLPWLALAAATGVNWVAGLIPDQSRRQIAITIAALFMLFPAFDTLRDPFHQQARASLAHIQATPEIPLFVSAASQPIADTYLKPGPKDRSACEVMQAKATTTRCTAGKVSGDGAAFQGAATKWYLMNYVSVATWGGSDIGFPGTSVKAFSSQYYDWLVAEMRKHKRAHFLLHQGNANVLNMLKSRLGAKDKLTRIIDERPPSPTLAHSAAQLFLLERGL